MDIDESVEDVTEDESQEIIPGEGSVSSTVNNSKRNTKEYQEWEALIEGLPDELRDLFRQMMTEDFPPDYGEADEYDYNEYQRSRKPSKKPSTKPKKNYGFGSIGPKENAGFATEALVSFGLSQAGRAVDSCQVAYLKLDLRNKNLKHITVLSGYIHLRNIDLSDNNLTSLIPLTTINHLQVLNAQGNQIASMKKIPYLRWLQALNLSRNQLTNLDGFHVNYVTYLNLSHNLITSVDDYLDFGTFQNLLSLELRGNKLKTIQGLNLPLLRHLYIAENSLINLEGLSGCPALEFLHARNNKIQVLTNFSCMEKLQRVNLRGNSIWRFTETIRLEDCPMLEILNLEGNPVSSSENYVLEMAAACLSLKRLDKRLLSELELIEGRLLRTGRSKGVGVALEDDLDLARLVEQEYLGEIEEE